MVVVCEKCETRFHLDESRVPAEGAQVRCSRCSHAFHIAAPRSEKPDDIDEVVAEVTGPGDFEEDWEFNDDSPAQTQVDAEPESSETGEFDVTALDLAGDAPPSTTAPDSEDLIPGSDTGLFPDEPASTDPVEQPSIAAVESSPIDPVESLRARDAGLDFSSPDDLGSPTEWDFVGTAEAAPPLELTPEDEDSESPLGRVDESGTASHSPAQAESPAGTMAAAEEPDRGSLAARFAVVGSIASWVVVALAFSVGMSALFTQPGEGGAVGAGPAEIAVSGLSLTAIEVEGRLVENALAGNLLVVSGELENRGSAAVTPGRPVWVQLLSAEGVAIDGATAAAGRAVAETELREWDPDRLRRDLQRSSVEIAHRPLRPGARVRFDAVFESIPESAAGWVLQAATSPIHLDPGKPLPSAAPLAWE